jgi:hypothetical protein
VAVRRLAAFAVLLGVACGSTRPLEVPPPFEDDGIVVTLKPRVYIDWPLGFEWLRGTVENRTGRDIDLWLYLNLVDDNGGAVGHAWVLAQDFRRGERRRFEAIPLSGPPGAFNLRLFEKPPSYTKVTRGLAWDQRGYDRMLACLGAITSWIVTRPPPQAARPAAQARGS